MAIVNHVDLVIGGEQWATSQAADHTYSYIEFHSGQHIMHEWIVQAIDCRHTPTASDTECRSLFLHNPHFIVIKGIDAVNQHDQMS